MGVTDTTLVSYVSRIATDLVPFLAATSEDALSLSLETLSAILDVDRGKWITTEVANSLVLAALEVWMKNNKGEAGILAIHRLH
jgi:importin-9